MAEHSSSSYGTFSPRHDSLQHPSDHASDQQPGGASSSGDVPRASSPAPLLSGHHEKRSNMQPSAYDSNDHNDAASTRSESRSARSAQAGVKRLEAIASTWSKTSLYIAYLGVALIAWATSLEGQTTINFTIFATSAFKAHALVATVLVVQGVVLSVVKPPMSKIADVFGRFEAFSLSVFVFVIGYIQQAAANNVETYAAAQLFYAAGQTGLQILIQIFIADTSTLLNRALIVTLPDVPFLFNVWIGPPLADRILKTLGWRWGYGMWAIILPLAFLPLGLSLFLTQRKAAKNGLIPPSPFQGKSPWAVIKNLWFELDFFGLVLLCAGFGLLLIPLTLKHAVWSDPSMLSMLLVGAACVVAFPFWERNKTLAPRAFFPRSLTKNRTVLAGLAFSFFYFMAFYLSVFPYFQSYLIVVRGLSVPAAGHIVQIFTFSATITSILCSLLIKYSKRYRIFVTVGATIYLLGLILMIFVRREHTSLTAIIGSQILIGIGGGMCHGPAQLGVQASASHSEVAAATAAFLTLLEIGGACGSAISGAIWSANIPKKLQEYLPEETQNRIGDIFGNVTLAATGWPMGSPTREAINQAYQETMNKILIVAVVVAVPCVFLSLLMKDYKLDEIDQAVRGTVIGGASPDALTASTARLLGGGDGSDDEVADEDNDNVSEVRDLYDYRSINNRDAEDQVQYIQMRRSTSNLRRESSGHS